MPGPTCASVRTAFAGSSSCSRGESPGDFADLARLRTLIDPWTAGVADEDLTVIRCVEYTFRAVVADRWRAGNAFVLGDAAHLTPPFIGQGMCAGVRDAANLAWKLAEVVRGDAADAELLLESYEAERKPHATSVVKQAVLLGVAMTGGGRLASVLRRLVMPRLRWVPGLSAMVVDSATPALKRGPLVDRGRAGRLAGTLAPSVWVGPAEHVDDVLGPGWSVLTTEPSGAVARDAVAAHGARVIDASATPALAAWLGERKVCTVVVRPDRVVHEAS